MKTMKNWTLAALLCAAALPSVSQARDTTLFPDFQAAVQERARAAGIPFLPKPITAETLKAIAEGAGV